MVLRTLILALILLGAVSVSVPVYADSPSGATIVNIRAKAGHLYENNDFDSYVLTLYIEYFDANRKLLSSAERTARLMKGCFSGSTTSDRSKCFDGLSTDVLSEIGFDVELLPDGMVSVNGEVFHSKKHSDGTGNFVSAEALRLALGIGGDMNQNIMISLPLKSESLSIPQPEAALNTSPVPPSLQDLVTIEEWKQVMSGCEPTPVSFGSWRSSGGINAFDPPALKAAKWFGSAPTETKVAVGVGVGAGTVLAVVGAIKLAALIGASATGVGAAALAGLALIGYLVGAHSVPGFIQARAAEIPASSIEEIRDYINRIPDLRNAVESGRLSEEEVSETAKKLGGIETLHAEVVRKFGPSGIKAFSVSEMRGSSASGSEFASLVGDYGPDILEYLFCSNPGREHIVKSLAELKDIRSHEIVKLSKTGKLDEVAGELGIPLKPGKKPPIDPFRLPTSTMRDRLRKAYPDIPVSEVEDVHHIFPIKFAKNFLEIGINVNDGRHLLPVLRGKHRVEARAWNEAWEKILRQSRALPTRPEAFKEAESLLKKHGLQPLWRRYYDDRFLN